MKRILLITLLAIMVTPIYALPVKLSGKALVEKGSAITEMVLARFHAGKSQESLPVDMAKNKYSITVECTPSCFGMLYAVITDSEGNKRQEYLPIYLSAEHKNVRLDIDFAPKGAPIVKTKNRELSALLQFNELAYTHYLTGTLPQEEVKPFIDKFFDTAHSAITSNKCNDEVASYINIGAYIQTVNTIERLQRMEAKNDSYIAALKAITDNLPAENKIFDNTATMLYSSGAQCVLQSISHKEKTAEARLQLLRQTYTDSIVVKTVEALILNNYISTYNYNIDANAGYERLVKMTEGNPEAEKYLSQFRMRSKSIVGAEAPHEAFLDIDGNEVRFSDFKGKYIYVDFWASWCGPCVREIPHLQKLEAELQNDNVVFIAISLDTDRNAWIQKMQQLGMSGHQYIVKDNKLATMLNIKGIPFYIIYDKEGKLLEYKAPRPSTGALLKEKLESLK
ncbi:MAG: TlpA family protein disulfide reductase [Coprobacter sp.]|nr:TlpA family protein disulfide reductase [Coprobacter sp.]